jgi:5-methylcytosine-specific restriction protein B
MTQSPLFGQQNIWCTRALRGDGSVFSERALWRLEYLEAIEQYYVNKIDQTDRTFLEKLKEQLTPTTPETKELVAEMLWVMLLCPSNLTAEKKREDVNLVWSWSGQELPIWVGPRHGSRLVRGKCGQKFPNRCRWITLTAVP